MSAAVTRKALAAGRRNRTWRRTRLRAWRNHDRLRRIDRIRSADGKATWRPVRAALRVLLRRVPQTFRRLFPHPVRRIWRPFRIGQHWKDKRFAVAGLDIQRGYIARRAVCHIDLGRAWQDGQSVQQVLRVDGGHIVAEIPEDNRFAPVFCAFGFDVGADVGGGRKGKGVTVVEVAREDLRQVKGRLRVSRRGSSGSGSRRR